MNSEPYETQKSFIWISFRYSALVVQGKLRYDASQEHGASVLTRHLPMEVPPYKEFRVAKAVADKTDGKVVACEEEKEEDEEDKDTPNTTGAYLWVTLPDLALHPQHLLSFFTDHAHAGPCGQRQESSYGYVRRGVG